MSIEEKKWKEGGGRREEGGGGREEGGGRREEGGGRREREGREGRGGRGGGGRRKWRSKEKKKWRSDLSFVLTRDVVGYCRLPFSFSYSFLS